MSLGPALAQELKASLGEVDYLTLVVLLRLIFVILDLLVRDLPDHLHNIFGLADQANQLLVFGLEEL